MPTLLRTTTGSKIKYLTRKCLGKRKMFAKAAEKQWP